MYSAHLCVQVRQVGRQIVDALRVQEPADHIAGLQLAHGLAVLCHSRAIVAARI